MRILLLHSRPLEFGKTTGGVPEFLFAITQQYKELGIDVSIYAGHKSFKTLSHTSTAHDSVKIYSGPILEPGFFISRKNIMPLAELCRREKIQLLHAQGTYTPGFMVRELAKLTRLPYVVTSHSDIHPVNSMRLKRRNVRSRLRRILEQASWVTHLTPVMEQASHQLFDTSNKSTLIHNGIDVESWLPYQQRPEKNYLLGIGRLERGKGFHILIEMYAELIRRGHTTSLVIAGTGQEDQALRAQCANLGLNVINGWNGNYAFPEKSVIFTGYVRGELKFQLIAESQCVLFATQPDLWEEAFGIVQLEAMAAGKPLVASDIAASKYLEKLGMQAVIVPPKDIDAWTDGVERLLNAPALRRVQGDANAAAIQQFHWRGIAKQYQEVYQAVLAGLPNGLKA